LQHDQTSIGPCEAADVKVDPQGKITVRTGHDQLHLSEAAAAEIIDDWTAGPKS
jgi:hypothetical protein